MRAGRRGQHDLVADHRQPEPGLFLPPRPFAGGGAPRLVGDPGDRPGGGGDLSHQLIRRGAPEPGRDRVLVLEAQHIAPTPGFAMQLHPRRDERLVAPLEGRLVLLR